MANSEAMDAICRVLTSYQHFTITTHIHPDGDAIGSELAFYSFLKALDKHVTLVNRDRVPPNFRFLPHADQILTQPPSEPSEVLIVLDAGDLSRIGEELVAPLRPQQCLLNIDHHAHGTQFGDHNLIMPDACATAEILYYFFTEYGPAMGIPSGDEIGNERAMCLYTGIMYDTGCFRYSNASPAAHQVAARLIEEGIEVDRIYDNVYEYVPARKVQLLAEVLQTLQLSPDGKLAWLHVTQQMLQAHSATDEDLDGFINHARAIESVEVALLFSERNQGGTKVSLRSRGKVDVGAISAALGGGGHARAAGCTLPEAMATSIPNVVTAVTTQMNQAFSSSE